MSPEEIISNLQTALGLLEKGRVTQGVEVLEKVGDFGPKTEEQVTLLESVSVLLVDDWSTL